MGLVAAAAAARGVLLLVSFAGVLLRPASAEITKESFREDSRGSILIDKFGFGPHGNGMVSISVTGAKAASSLANAKPDPTQLGFFLLSNETMLEALYGQSAPTDLNRPYPESSPTCVLSSAYVIPLFTFADLADGYYNHTFPIIRPDEYNLFFANCAPETNVTMDVRIDMYNTSPGPRNLLLRRRRMIGPLQRFPPFQE